ncbi:MAG: FxLYD domain-containing protein [bacterium]|nr:FxLYD domain-containing protein [bacterium]
MFEDNDRIQEFFFVLGNKLEELDKKQWYTLLTAVVLVIPLFFILRFGFYQAFFSGYEGPEITHVPIIPEPLQIVDKGIFKLNSDTYSGYVKIRNINLDRGVPEQEYLAEFETAGGTVVSRMSGKTFVLPAQDKLLVFTRFTVDREPSELNFSLSDSRFIYESSLPPIITEVQRVQMEGLSSEFAVSAVIKNLSPFVISQIYLPVVLYNSQNEIVGVNSTNINDVRSLESRSFRVVWPNAVAGAVRAEIRPEINIFDRKIINTESGQSQFDDLPEVNTRGY